MYRRPKFLEILLSVRQEMAREADYDVDLFAEMVRSGRFRPMNSTSPADVETPKPPRATRPKRRAPE